MKKDNPELIKALSQCEAAYKIKVEEIKQLKHIMENLNDVIKKLCEAYDPEQVQAALDLVKASNIKADGDPIPPNPTHP